VCASDKPTASSRCDDGVGVSDPFFKLRLPVGLLFETARMSRIPHAFIGKSYVELETGISQDLTHEASTDSMALLEWYSGTCK
jgi:hypothetical protein